MPTLRTRVLMSQQSSIDPAFVTPIDPTPEIKDKPDTMPSDYQPPGTDEEPQSLAEALTG